MSPIDYTSAFADLPAPGDSFMKGLQGGLAINQVQAQQQQQQAGLVQQQQQQQVIRQLIGNPSAGAEEYASATLLVPGMREQFKQAWETRNTAQQQQHLSDLSQWGAALQNGQPQLVVDAMNARADALENTARGAPTRESQALRAQAQAIKEHPEFGGFMIKSMLVAHPDGGKVVDAIAKLGVEDRAAAQAPADLRQANAKAGEAEADVTQKNLGIIGQTLGPLQGKNAKPGQAKAAITSLVARGVIPKDEKQTWLDAVPTDPKQLDAWLGTMRATGMKPDDQMKYVAPTADAALSAATQVKTTGMNNATTLKVQDRIDARQEAKGDAEPTLPPEALSMMAQQYLAGDKSVMQNLGRGAQGAANIVALRAAITKEAGAKGMTGPQIAATIADYGGLTAGLRTSAQISARVENAISEAKELAPLAIAASKEVSRSGLLPFGKLGLMFDTQTNDPKLKKFATANNGLVSAYAGAMARGQKPTVSDYDHAREILLAAQSHEAYEATVGQMYAEMAAASKAPQNVREHLRNEIGGGKGAGHGAAPASAAPAASSAGWSVRRVN